MRETIITRTTKIFTVEYVGIDISTGITETKTKEFTKVPKDILAYIRKLEETDTYKIIAVNAVNESIKRFGITESDFMKYATEMPLLVKKDKGTDN